MKFKKITSFVLAITVFSTMLIQMPLIHAAASTLEVGTDKRYHTIHDAVEAAKKLNPQSEADRVTINVDPGNYEEQVRIDNAKYITLQQTPNTDGKVNLSWYFCTGYCTSNTDLTGLYDPTIDWSREQTWKGYKEGDEEFTKYEIGQRLEGVSKISYYDTNGAAHKDVPVNSQLKNLGGLGWSYDKMAALIVTKSSSDITVKDFNIVNTVPVMKIQAEIDGHLTPEQPAPGKEKDKLLDHSSLSICSEDTTMVKPTADIYDSNNHVDKEKYKQFVASGHVFSPGESAWLLRSSIFNERGHALASLGDRIIFENVRARGNQDSIWVSDGRAYFKNCTLIGGTDYIYGSANAVFDNCRLGFAGFTDYPYGNPLTTPNTDSAAKYGYLFFNCTVYNECDNSGVSNFGGPWGASGQATFYNTTIDDNGTIGNSKVQIDTKGWGRFGAEDGLSRMYEYGTRNKSGNAVDLSKRIVNKSVEDGGQGMGTVLDKWQILEFNPRNYFSMNCDPKYKDDWDPMNFGATYLVKIDSEIAAAAITVPAGDATEISLPDPTDSNIEFHWVSASTNAVVSNDETKMTVTRPSFGEEPIVTSVILYARDKTTGYGDKKEIPVTINATTDSTNVFNIPVTIKQSASSTSANDYTVTISKDNALIKQQVITVPANQSSVSAEISNIPASASGIKYDVKIVPVSDDFSITAPADGNKSITGITGQNTALEITAQKLIDEKVDLDVSYSSSDGNKVYDLIALAKEKGAASSISSSDIITVSYKLDVNQDSSTSGNSFIDLLSDTPSGSVSQSGVQSRFVLAKLGHWNQLDFVDSAQGFSGSSNGPDQYLNACGKFNKGTPSNVSVTIDYKNQTLTITGSGTNSEKSYSLETFPAVYEKGKLNMAVYSGGESFSISNISVTYKKLVADDEPLPTETPGPTVTPTAAPTLAPTVKPTNMPDNKAAVKDVKIENGNTVVILNNIADGVVIAAKYNDKALADVKTKDAAGNTVTIEGIEADKIMVWDSLKDMKPLCDAYTVDKSGTPTTNPIEDPVVVDFTAMSAVPEYSAESGQGFVTKSGAIMPSGYERQVASASNITVSSDGAKITETTGLYLHEKNNSDDGDDYNNGGLIYRIDTGKAGAYHLEVEITGTSADTIVAPTGMNGGNLTGTSNWDNCEQVPRTVSAKWDGSVWSYDFATGENFVEIEIEPKTLASASKAQTVGVKKITLTPLDNNSAGNKPTIHILGDSTQKSYSFNETISAWGQTIKNYFDLDKVNVVNYSMGGRAMKSNYCEGRFDEILIRGKQGDFVFIHSAHNDETISTNRFSRGAGTKSDDLTVNNENYNRWLNMYIEAIKARGMTPVLVTAMPRVNGSTGKYNESTAKPNGFNPDSPANMRAKAASDPDVGLAELYAGAKAYIDKLDGKEVAYIYNNTEAGEIPAANAANGAKGDGTHYKEAAAKQWSRIILQSIYDQSVASTNTYTDKDIMTKLVSLMPEKVKAAAQTGDWSEVFPEMASDVSAVDIVPGAQKQAESNFYYRNNIEKALQLGLLHKDTQNLFKPTATITVGEFARGIEKAFGLEENSLTSYTKTYAELAAETASVNSMSADNIAEADVYDNDIELMAEGDGKFTITVNQSEGGTVTVYNNSAFGTYTADVTADAAAGQVVSDNKYFKLTAPAENFAKKTRSSGVFADNPDISINYINFRKASSGSCIVEYAAKASGKLIVYASAGTNKPVELTQTDDSSAKQSYIVEGSPDGSNICGTVTFNVVAGTTYDLYTSGGTGMLFGVKYESTDYPQSTESLSVNSGDEIRVAAIPAENNVNGSIIVNGEAKTKAKEYTFKAEGNTTVSATFISEPALVEVTKIASDAALTREAMGAILYDAYQAFQESGSSNAKEYMERYMKNNGGIPSPSDPNYDPNIQYEGSPYIPTVGWGALTDTSSLTDSLYMKVKNAYNLGLIRSEQGIGRGRIGLGSELEPKAEVTRAKAAKALVFAFTLTQKPNDESQLIPAGYALSTPSEIPLPNTNAQTTVFN